MILRSALLDAHGFVHGFSTREGGVSQGPFASLNLARTVGDDPAHVLENTRRFEAALGGPRLFEVSQVHGCAVVAIDGDGVEAVRSVEADALVAQRPGDAVGVRTADCVPILLGDVETGRVAAVHAGWRGVEQRIVEVAIARLGSPASIVAAIGPHIRLDAFEVSDEIAARIAAASHGERVVEPRSPRPHVDLARALVAQLRAAGVERVEDVGGCTVEEARFFSHRRDAGRTGRHLSAIVAR